MYELVILGILTRWPRHGYHIAKIVNDAIGPWAKLSNGALYPLLNRLEAKHLIVSQQQAGQPTERRQRVFAVTEEGKRHFQQLMLDTAANPGEYQKLFWFKSLFLDLIAPEERLQLLDHYINYCQTHLFHLRSRDKALGRRVYQLNADEQRAQQQAAGHPYLTPAHRWLVAEGLRHRADQWQLELTWAQHLRDQALPPDDEQAAPSRRSARQSTRR